MVLLDTMSSLFYSPSILGIIEVAFGSQRFVLLLPTYFWNGETPHNTFKFYRCRGTIVGKFQFGHNRWFRNCKKKQTMYVQRNHFQSSRHELVMCDE